MKENIKSISRSIGYILLCLIISIFLYLQFPDRPVSHPFDYGEWEAGSVKHILPSFDHRQLLLKVSFVDELSAPPSLQVGDKKIIGSASGINGKYWQFYIDKLTASTAYELSILSGSGIAITSPWNITTFPHPDSSATALKALLYTCAGGISESFFGKEIFLDMVPRRSLLIEGLSHDPRIVVANGDHVYWDQKTFEISLIKRLLLYRRNRQYGKLDLTKSMLHHDNYYKFTSIVDDQISELYGCLLREKSVYFLTDDHDLLENDEALESIISLPPTEYMLDAARSTQLLYYPEFLGNKLKPSDFPDMISKTPGLSTSFGMIKYGSLAEFNMYDCKRYCSIDGKDAVVIPRVVEQWLSDRQQSNSKWVIQVPSTPLGYTAGKWAEWYPDVLDGSGSLSIKTEKYMWPKGWWNQHQRILNSISLGNHTPVIMQGDLHMASAGKIMSSGKMNFSNNPIHILTTAPLGSGKLGFPSSVRNTGAEIPVYLEVEEDLRPLEKNGFTIAEISQTKMKFKIYTWRPYDGIENISGLRPTYETVIPNSHTASNKISQSYVQ
ncbi:MAG: hypothetical protein ACI9FN_000077 [Saprospiraceae bacterium]|jgi:hypothetical protein